MTRLVAERHPTSSPRMHAFVVLVVALFFIWGGATSLNDILIPKLKGLFSLSYAEVMLTQFAFFMAYFLVSVPAGALVTRIGYVRGMVAGLVIMASGALLFWPASLSGSYWPFLVALFVLAAGITILQVAANPLIATLGDPAGASSRLTFAQAFNSLGTTIWPYIGAGLILQTSRTAGHGVESSEAAIVGHIYLAIALVLAIVALVFWARRNQLPIERLPKVGFLSSLGLLKSPRLFFGTIALFVYVGAEVSIGSVLVSYLQQSNTLGLTAQSAGEHLSLYWGGAMVGRFVGAWLLGRIDAGTLLGTFAVVAAALVVVSIGSHGASAGWALISVGVFNSIMFPTIFSLALEGQGTRTPEASGLLCMAIVGGALIPVATGALADAHSIGFALAVPVICYVVVALFGQSARARKA